MYKKILKHKLKNNSKDKSKHKSKRLTKSKSKRLTKNKSNRLTKNKSKIKSKRLTKKFVMKIKPKLFYRLEINHIKILNELCCKNYDKILDLTTEKMKEIGGVITNDNEFIITKHGKKNSIEPHCESGFLADFHSHPPLLVMSNIDEDTYFLPFSPADIYISLINATLNRNIYSVVFSVEGIYILKIGDDAIKAFKKDLKNINIDLADKHIVKCDFIMKPNMAANNGNFMGFKKDEKLKFLSELFDGTGENTINEKTFNLALKKYIEHYKKFDIDIYYFRPTNAYN